jgi:hypothetical protein
MPASLLADLILIGHLGIIVFAVFGALWTLRWGWAPLVHLPVLAWAAYIELSAGICPLTPLENSLRRAAGESGYSSSFIEHYLVPLVYPPGLTSGAQLWLAASLLLLNGLFYAYVVARHRVLRVSGRSATPRS